MEPVIKPNRASPGPPPPRQKVGPIVPCQAGILADVHSDRQGHCPPGCHPRDLINAWPLVRWGRYATNSQRGSGEVLTVFWPLAAWSPTPTGHCATCRLTCGHPRGWGWRWAFEERGLHEFVWLCVCVCWGGGGCVCVGGSVIVWGLDVIDG